MEVKTDLVAVEVDAKLEGGELVLLLVEAVEEVY